MAIDPISQAPRPDIPEFDRPRAEAAVRELLIAVGEDPDREGLLETPARVARAYQEMLAGMRIGAEDVLTTTFDAGHEEMILVKDIELWSMCEHHLVPFTGVAHVGYIPNENGKITGLSKLARLVDTPGRVARAYGETFAGLWQDPGEILSLSKKKVKI
jgi:GTP cyclohydrolase I